jgi:FkbM family methyltransferase
LARLVGGSGLVVAFEPVETVYTNLAFNSGLNASLNITPVCAAACDRNGRSDFVFDEDRTTQGRLADVEPTYRLPAAKTISVRAVRLDEYSYEGWPPPSVLKIDVEGGAGAVLRGAHNLLSKYRPLIYIELHGPEEQRAAGHLLTQFRYRATTLSGSHVPDPTAKWASPLICTPL